MYKLTPSRRNKKIGMQSQRSRRRSTIWGYFKIIHFAAWKIDSLTPIQKLNLTAARRVFLREGTAEVVRPGSKKKEFGMYLYLFNDLLLITQPKKAKQSGGDARPKKTKLKEVLLFKTQCLLVPANGKSPVSSPAATFLLVLLFL